MMVFKRSSTPARRVLGGLVVAALVACVSMIEAKKSNVRRITSYDEYTEAINDGKVYITAYKVRAG